MTAHCKTITPTTSDTIGCVGRGGSLESSSAAALVSCRSRSERKSASTLKRWPSGKKQVQTASRFKTTQPPFSIMMLRLPTLMIRSAAKICINRVR